MSNISAAELAQRAIDAKLITASEVEQHFGTLDLANVGFHEFTGLAINQNLLTNFQISRLVNGHTGSFFYGKHKLKHLIDTEIYARVYRGENVDTKQSVTIKILRKRFNNDSDVREQFAREAKHIGCHIASDQDRLYVVVDSSCN